MKKIVILVLVLFQVLSLSAYTGGEIMQRVIDTQEVTSSAMDIRMTLINTGGDTDERRLQTLVSREGGRTKTITLFLSPARIKNTRFLTISYESANDDQWIYLPSLRKVKRITAGEQSGSFMGSDFSYSDMSSTVAFDDSTHTLMKEEGYKGILCYVVESIPGENNSVDYGKTITWVDSQTWLPVKVEFYTKDSLRKIKEMLCEEFTIVQDRWTARKITMTTLADSHSTVMEILQAKYDVALNPGYFTTAFLETGESEVVMKSAIFMVFVLLGAFAFTAPISGQDTTGFSDIFAEEFVLDEGTTGVPLETNLYPLGTSSLQAGGIAGYIYGLYLDSGWESERISIPFTNLDLLLDTQDIQAAIKLKLDFESPDESPSYRELIDELSIRAFFPFGYLEAGLMTVEWGKGDGIHVIDPLNPFDQSGRFEPDLTTLKRAEAMIKLNTYLGDTGLLELVYKPFFHPHSTAPDGRWAVVDMDTLPNLQPAPDTETWEYEQIAARLTGSLPGIDLGMIYYKGFFNEPGYKFVTEFTGTDPLNPAHYTTTTSIEYTKAQLIGIEAALAAGPLTLRTETGYWFSEDAEGDIAHLYNDHLNWLAGIDIYIPGTSWLVSIQEVGQYTLNFDGLAAPDVDAVMSYNNKAVTNTLLAAVEGTFARDMMRFRLSGLYLFEANGYMVMPEIFWYITDNFELLFRGTVFGGDNTGNNPYYIWDDNDNITIELKIYY